MTSRTKKVVKSIVCTAAAFTVGVAFSFVVEVVLPAYLEGRTPPKVENSLDKPRLPSVDSSYSRKLGIREQIYKGLAGGKNITVVYLVDKKGNKKQVFSSEDWKKNR